MAEPIEMLFGWVTQVGGEDPCVRWGSRSLKGKAQFLGVVGPIHKHCESLLQCMQQKQ